MTPRVETPSGQHVAQPGEDSADRASFGVAMGDWGVHGRLARPNFASGLALHFTILTAVQISEALGATWGEVDLAKAVWTVPAARMNSHLPSTLRQLIRM